MRRKTTDLAPILFTLGDFGNVVSFQGSTSAGKFFSVENSVRASLAGRRFWSC
jgi:hypothetical protein